MVVYPAAIYKTAKNVSPGDKIMVNATWLTVEYVSKNSGSVQFHFSPNNSALYSANDAIPCGFSLGEVDAVRALLGALEHYTSDADTALAAAMRAWLG